MNELAEMIWVEQRKAIRSRMPIWTALGALFLPLGIAFLIFVSRNPEISQKLGLISAKANLLAYAGTDWPGYIVYFGQTVAIGGFMLALFAISWTFGREFADGTVKDLLAVPVRRSSILLAKFGVVGVWSVGLALVMLAAGLAMGALIRLPGGARSKMLARGCLTVLVTALHDDHGDHAIRAVRQHRAGLPAAGGAGNHDDDTDQHRGADRVGRILPLGGGGAVRARENCSAGESAIGS